MTEERPWAIRSGCSWSWQKSDGSDLLFFHERMALSLTKNERIKKLMSKFPTLIICVIKRTLEFVQNDVERCSCTSAVVLRLIRKLPATSLSSDGGYLQQKQNWRTPHTQFFFLFKDLLYVGLWCGIFLFLLSARCVSPFLQHKLQLYYERVWGILIFSEGSQGYLSLASSFSRLIFTRLTRSVHFPLVNILKANFLQLTFLMVTRAGN